MNVYLINSIAENLSTLLAYIQWNEIVNKTVEELDQYYKELVKKL
ncbi:hypothetical protein D929_00013 [Enterococcus faecalis 02-MB-P-10]|nr:hypothetical protein D929_00013 [Enterococcus faecalis 02-MB-P-10]